MTWVGKHAQVNGVIRVQSLWFRIWGVGFRVSGVLRVPCVPLKTIIVYWCLYAGAPLFMKTTI